MAEYTSSIELKAVTRDLDKKLGKVTKDLRGIDTQVQKTQGAFSKMTKKASRSFDKLNKKLKESKAQLAGLSVAIGGIALKGVADFKKFEDGITQIATLGVKDLKKVENQLNTVRKAFGITGAEATKGYYDIISAGAKTSADALDQLVAATKLAKAGNTDLAGAVDIVTSGLNVFKDAGLSASDITDKLFLAVKFGKTTVEELGTTFGMVAPIVKTAGGSMEDYASAMATITAGGIKTNQATTGLSSIMSNLVKVTPKAEKEAKRLGIAWGTSSIQTNGFVGTLENLKDALAKDESGGTMAYKLGRLFDSKESIGAVSVLLENFDKFKNINKEMANAAGTTATAMELVKQTASFNFARFNQSLSIMSQNIGAAVVPGLLDMADAFGPVVDFMANLIAKNPGIVKVTIAITALATSLAFLGGPATLAIAGIGTVLFQVMKKFNEFENAGTIAFEVLELKWANFLGGLKRMTIGDVFRTMFDASVGWVSKMVTKIKDKAADLTAFFVDPIKEACAKVDKFFHDLYIAVVGNSYVPDMVKEIKAWVAMLKAWFVKPIEGFVEKVKGYFAELTGDDMTPSETVEKVWTDLTDAITTGWEGAQAAAQSYWEEVDGDEKVTAVTTTIKDGWTEATDAVNLYLKSVKESLNQDSPAPVRTEEDQNTADTVGGVVRGSASIAVMTKLMTMFKNATDDGRASMMKLNKFDFGTLRRSIQANIQQQRIFAAAISDDMGKVISTDKATTNRAMEDATKTEQRIRKEQIARARTLGPELAQERLAALRKEEAKLMQEAEARNKNIKGRGMISRLLFGQGTAITWTAKINGMMGQIGKAFGLVEKMVVGLGKQIDARLSNAGKLRLAEEKTIKAQQKVTTAKGNLDAEVKKGTSGSVEKTIKLQKVVDKENAKLAKATQTQAELSKSIGKNAGIIARNLRVVAMSFKGIMTSLGFAGTVARTGIEQSAKAAQKMGSVGATVANSKVATSAANAVKGLSRITGITATMKIFAGIARKVLIPIFAVVDAFRGFTMESELQKNMRDPDKALEDFTTSEKVISAMSEAIGNFFNGFLDLGGIVLEWFGADKMGEYMKGIDLAPEVAKVIESIGNIFKTIRNVFMIIGDLFTGENAEESIFTTAVKKAGSIISEILSIFVTITETLEGLTSGEIKMSDLAADLTASISTFFKDLGQAMLDSIKDAVAGLGNWASDLIKDTLKAIIPSFGKNKENVASNGNDMYEGANLDGFLKFNTGGPVFGAGTATSDSIPAMLSNGEYVINAKQTDKYRGVLEAINSGRPLPGFKTGGEVGKHYNFLQFDRTASPHGDNTGSGDFGSFSFDKTMALFLKNMDKTHPLYKETQTMLQEVADSSKNLTEEDVNRLDITKHINRNFLEMSASSTKLDKNTLELAETVKGAAGAIDAKAEADAKALQSAMDFGTGLGQVLTGPIKQAFLEGGSIMDGFKMGIHNLMQNISGKFLDRAFSPIESAIDKMFINMDNALSTSINSSISNMGSSTSGAAAGGFWSSIGSFLGFSKGGIVPQYLATGGTVMNGPKGTDTVPAWLTPGEVVLNAGQQKNVANAMNQKPQGNTVTINISGNVDQRAINQIKQVVASDPMMIHQLNENGKRSGTGLQRRR